MYLCILFFFFNSYAEIITATTKGLDRRGYKVNTFAYFSKKQEKYQYLWIEKAFYQELCTVIKIIPEVCKLIKAINITHKSL